MMAPARRQGVCECGRALGQCIKGDLDVCDAPIAGEWVNCWNCGGEGVIEGECTCMDDTCCCLDPEPPICGICEGAGGWTAK